MAKPSGGQKGNNNATKNKVWADAVRKALVQGKKLDTLAKKLIEMACEGDIQAIKEIGDRLDGKPSQAIVGEVTHTYASELTDNDLENIAATSRQRATKSKDSEKELH